MGGASGGLSFSWNAKSGFAFSANFSACIGGLGFDVGTTQVWGTDGAYAGGIENEAVWAGMLSMHAGVGVQFGWGSMASCTGAYLDMTMFGITATHNFDTGQNSVGVSAQASYYWNRDGSRTLSVFGIQHTWNSPSPIAQLQPMAYDAPAAPQVPQLGIMSLDSQQTPYVGAAASGTLPNPGILGGIITGIVEFFGAIGAGSTVLLTSLAALLQSDSVDNSRNYVVRVQAQGSQLERSEVITSPNPITATQVQDALVDLVWCPRNTQT